MTLKLSGHFSIFGLVFFVPNSPLGIARQWSREKFVILTLSLGVIYIFNISNVGYSVTYFSTVCYSKTCTVPQVPCKRKVDPCKFLSVQKTVQKFTRNCVNGV